MSTSSDPVVLRDVPAHRVVDQAGEPDLRTGRWTRLGTGAVLGDRATEAALGGLAEAADRAARAQGYARGWAEGRRSAHAQVAADAAARSAVHEAEHARAMDELRRAAQALTRAKEDLEEGIRLRMEELAAATVDLALQVAEAVIDREIRTATDPGADALRRALAEVPGPGPVTVRLHPDDLAALDAGDLDGSIVLCPDPTLARGDATAATPSALVDATVSGALARVREVLAS